MNTFNYFDNYKIGTLFLIRTPESFPAGYAEKSMADMAEIGMDYATWLETWNCVDGVLWKSPEFPRSSHWKGEERDPIEETFLAAERHGMAFLPEAGYMHQSFFDAHPDAWVHDEEGPQHRYSRLGLVPDAEVTVDYFIHKYETLIEKFKDCKSLIGVCLPSENCVHLSYDKFTREAYRNDFGCEIPSALKIKDSQSLSNECRLFGERRLAIFFSRLGAHIKEKYGLALMHYPLGLLSGHCHFQPRRYAPPTKTLSFLMPVPETDIFNMQIHPTLEDNPYCFKMESEIIQALCGDRPCVADTHFYHEFCDGKLPPATPKRFRDWTLSTLTPHGISFFSYGFFAPELPEWKKEINPGAPVYHAYSEPAIVDSRRRETVKALSISKKLAPFLSHSRHSAECAIYYTEDIGTDFVYGSYEKEHLFGLYELFQAAAVPITFSTSIPVPGSGIKTLFIHSLKTVSPEFLNSAMDYIQSGGNIVFLGDCAPNLLKAFKFEIETTQAHFVKKANPAQNESECYFSCPSASKNFHEKSGDPLFFWNNGTTAVSEKNIGTGKVIYIGAGAAFSSFNYNRHTQLIDFLKSLLVKLNDHLEVDLKCAFRRSCEHRYLSSDIYAKINEDASSLIIRNFGLEAENIRIKWTRPQSEYVEILVDGEKVNPKFIWANNALELTIEHLDDLALIWTGSSVVE